MSKYQNGKIYKIWDFGYNQCYVGSSCQNLKRRFTKHRNSYTSYLAGKSGFVSAYALFDEYGVENCKIELVEYYACNNKEELEAREGQIQREVDCINKRVAGRTPEQYREENREVISERKKEEYQKHREERLDKAREYRAQEGHSEKHSQYCKERYINKKDEIQIKRKEHRENNLEKVREQERQAYQRNKAVKQRPWTCECGITMCFSAKSRHLKTNKHQQYLQNQNNPQE